MSESIRYRSRAALAAGAQIPMIATPTIVGPVESDREGVFEGLVDHPGPWDIDVETSLQPGTRRTLTLSATSLNDLIAEINAIYPSEIGARAEGRRLCLFAQTSGSGSYLRLFLPVSGDGTFLTTLQFPFDPHPEGTVYGDAVQDTPFRFDGNNAASTRGGTAFLRMGEGQSHTAINRALNALAVNVDLIRSDTEAQAPCPAAVWINDSLSMHLVLDSDDFIEQISLGMIESPVFHGAPLSSGTSMQTFSRFFALVDMDGTPLMGWEDAGTSPGAVRPVSIGMVTYGERQSARPTFSDTDAPDPLPSDTTGDASVGYSASGVYWEKVAAVDISAIQGDVLVCDDAEFVTAGVIAGDRVNITGSTQTGPYDNNGRWQVAEVLSETMIRLKPAKGGAHARLNPDDGVGALGTVQVQHNGEYSTGLYLTVHPPFRLPEGGVYLLCCVPDSLVSPAEAGSGRIALPLDHAVRGEVDTARGLGSVLQEQDSATVTRPIHLWSQQTNDMTSAGVGTLIASGSGSLRTGWVLRAPVGTTFLPSYAGMVVQLTGGLLLGRETFRITRYIDAAHLQIEPTASRLRDNFTGPLNVTWRIHQPGKLDLPATIQVDVPARYGAGPTAQHAGGLVILREQDDVIGTGATSPGFLGLGYLERVRRVGTTNILHLSGTFNGTATVRVSSGALDAADTIFPDASSSVRGTSSPLGGMFVRVLNGASAGWYRLHSISGADLTLRNLDGSTVTFAHDAAVIPNLSLYRVALGGPVLLSGVADAAPHVAGLIVDVDGGETGATEAIGAELRWRGEGRGLRIRGNDDTYAAHTTGRGSSGWAIELDGYAPMKGITANLRAEDNTGLADVRRRAEAGVFAAHSNVAWLDEVADATDWRQRGQTVDAPKLGAALRAHQSGRDPALIVTRDYERDINDAMPYHTSAAFVMIDIPQAGVMHHDGHYAGAFFFGGIYQRSSVEEGSFASGIISEAGIGAGRYLQPVLPLYVDPNSANWRYDSLDSPIDSPFAAPTLGSAGQVWPQTTDGDGGGYTYALTPPDRSRFNVPHMGVVSIECPSGDNALALCIGVQTGRFIGMRLRVSGAASRNGFYRITGAHVGDSEVDLQTVYFAVEQTTTDNLIATTLTPTAVTIHGERWFRFYGDVASWLQVGTAQTDDRAELPTVYTSLPANDTGHPHRSSTLPLSLTENRYESGGYSDLATATGAAYGVTLLQPRTLAEMADVGVEPGSYSAGWETEGEAASPFPDASCLVRTDEYRLTADGADSDLYGAVSDPGDTASPTSLRLSDFTLERVTSGGNTALLWSNRWGGSLCITEDPNNLSLASSKTVRLVYRGVNAILAASMSLTVRYRLALAGDGSGSRTRSVTVRLVQNNGTVIATTTTTLTFVDDVPVEHVALLSASDLYRAPDDTPSATTTTPCTVQLQIADSFGSGTIRWYVLSIEVLSSTRTIEVNSPIRASGAVAASAFKLTTPQTRFAPIHPSQARMLDGVDYARCWPDGWDDAQEGRPMVGLLRRSADTLPFEPTVDTSRMFRYGPGKATLIGNTIWNDPLAYVAAGSSYSASDVLRFPGPTGFVLPLDVPHGAVMTHIDLSLSFLPALNGTSTAEEFANFMIWHSIPRRRAHSGAEWKDRPTWDAVEGVNVRLWRGAAWERGTPATPTSDFSGLFAAPFGYPEEIYAKTIDLSEVTEPTRDINATSVEHHVLTQLVLTDTTGIRLNKALVDLRAFYYFVTIEFWVGMRSLTYNFSTSSYDLYGFSSLSPSNEPNYTPTVSDVRGVDVTGRTVFAPHDYPVSSYGAKTMAPPQVSFRGGKVVYRTDRIP